MTSLACRPPPLASTLEPPERSAPARSGGGVRGPNLEASLVMSGLARYDRADITFPTRYGEPAMAPPRTFSYERLKRLLRDHPTWTYPEYADVLTQDNRRDNPASARVK